MAVIECAECGMRVNAEAERCPECGADPATGEGAFVTPPPSSPNCPHCGVELTEDRKFCAECGERLAPPPSDAPTLQIPAAYPPTPYGAPAPQPTAQYVYVQQMPVAPRKKAPGIAITGFILALVGLVLGWIPIIGLPFGFVGIAGLICSTVGYSKAKREDLSKGLAIAGIAIGGIITSITLLWLILLAAARMTN